MLTARRIVALGVLLLLPLAAVAADVESRYREASAAFHELADSAAAGADDWRELAAAFAALEHEYPGHPRGPDALYSAGLALRQAFARGDAVNDAQRALDAFLRVAESYPQHRLADDSLMQAAHLQFHALHDVEAAAREYRRVLQSYPDGDQAEAAREQLAALIGGLARGGAGDAVPAQPSAGAPERAASGMLKRVQSWSTLSSTRIILTTNEQGGYRYGLIPKRGKQPARLYVDLEETEPAADLELEQTVEDTSISRIHVARQPHATTRVVLELKDIKDYAVKDFHLPAERKIIIDVHPSDAALLAENGPRDRNDAQRAQRPAGPGGKRPEETAAFDRPLGLKVRTVVIDPGHGGHDPGAVGFGLQEKDLALDIARRLKGVLQRNLPDLRVGMTREDDTFVALEDRPRIAKQQGADLFVSIHLNANPTERIHGVETYFLNLTADAAAIQVAARENAQTEKKVSDLNIILADLLQDANILESNRLARTLQASLVGELFPGFPVRNLGVKQAPFLVLIGSEMPSVLVETGFITNRRENRRFRDAGYREKIAEGIYAGLSGYIGGESMAQKKPPAVKVAKADS